ncbi:MAG: hypothetical protein ACR2JB_19010 [Bryobacteraceae bacterium]
MPENEPRNEKLWYTVKDLAEEWGISEGWIRDHATRKQPRIKGRKFGKFRLSFKHSAKGRWVRLDLSNSVRR